MRHLAVWVCMETQVYNSFFMTIWRKRKTEIRNANIVNLFRFEVFQKISRYFIPNPRVSTPIKTTMESYLDWEGVQVAAQVSINGVRPDERFVMAICVTGVENSVKRAARCACEASISREWTSVCKENGATPFNPLLPKAINEMFPAASPETLRHTEWRTLLFIAYLRRKMIHTTNSHGTLGENVFEWEWKG